jgi:hypothetical protein
VKIMERRTSENSVMANFGESDKGEVRAEGRAGKARNWSDRGNRTGGYSASTNSSKDTPYAWRYVGKLGRLLLRKTPLLAKNLQFHRDRSRHQSSS